MKFKKENEITPERNKEFYFGDPCYIFGNCHWWSYLCEHLDEKEKGTVVIFPNGDQMLIASTAFGDGFFDVDASVQLSNYLAPCDSGLLCVVPVETVKAYGGIQPDNCSYMPSFISNGETIWIDDEHNWRGQIGCITDDSDIEDDEPDHINGRVPGEDWPY